MIEQEGDTYMKPKIIAVAGVVILAAALMIALRPKSFDSQFSKTMKNMDSYILKGDMEITKGEDVKTYALEVGYEKGEQDLFKVSLTDKDLNQEQIILRNDDGVYVVTPSLNQIFKFEGDWPMNSPKPYLLQSISDIVQNDEAVIKKEKDGYRVTSEVSYPNNKNYHHEEIMFDKDSKLQWLQIFNQDNTAELKIVFRDCDYDAKLDDAYFKAPTSLEKSVSAGVIDEADLPLYPVQVFSSKLDNVSVLKNGNETKHVLEYSGEKNFTVVETRKESPAQTQTVIMPGQFIDTLGVVGFYDGSHLSAHYENVEISVFSEELGPDEMMDIVNSMQVAVMK